MNLIIILWHWNACRILFLIINKISSHSKWFLPYCIRSTLFIIYTSFVGVLDQSAYKCLFRIGPSHVWKYSFQYIRQFLPVWEEEIFMIILLTFVSIIYKVLYSWPRSSATAAVIRPPNQHNLRKWPIIKLPTKKHKMMTTNHHQNRHHHHNRILVNVNSMRFTSKHAHTCSYIYFYIHKQ